MDGSRSKSSSSSSSSSNKITASAISSSDRLRRYASLLGSTGVAAGAFGAHALAPILSQKPKGLENWKMAVTYQLVHACAIFALSSSSASVAESSSESGAGGGKSPAKESSGALVVVSSSPSSFDLAGKMMAVGSVMFSGSIYCLCLDVGPKKVLGPITPLGGLLMIGGWLVAGFGS
mmetsp:Transcript_21442/g.48713  ORF Transcript_21442/g.48713 Transcript_21442/m.48713 type:complete len:177 (-) Transcript_21442:292-822(-)